MTPSPPHVRHGPPAAVPSGAAAEGEVPRGPESQKFNSLPAGWTEYRPGRRESQTSAIAGGVFYFRRSVCKPCIPFPLVVSLEKRIPSQKCVRPGAALGRQESQVRRLRGPAAVCAGDSLPGCPKVLFLHAIVPLWGPRRRRGLARARKPAFACFPVPPRGNGRDRGRRDLLRYRLLRAPLGPGLSARTGDP